MKQTVAVLVMALASAFVLSSPAEAKGHGKAISAKAFAKHEAAEGHAVKAPRAAHARRSKR